MLGVLPERASVPWDSPTVRVVLVSTLLAPLGVPLVSPALPLIRDQFAVSDATASLLISVYFLTGIVLSPFIGMLADRIGRRRVLVPCLFVFAVSGTAAAFAPSFATLLLARLVQGTCAAGIFITTVTLIGDVFEGVQRNAVLGMNIAALSAGAAVFPVVGGALAAVSWNAPFYAYLLALPVALFAAVALPEPAGERETRSLAYLRGAVGVVVGTEVLSYYGAAFATELLLFGAVFTVLPYLLADSYGLSALSIGLVVTAAEVASIVVSSQNGRLASRVSNPRLVALGFVCYGVGLVVAWLGAAPLFVALGMVVVGAGLGLSMPSVDAAVSGAVPARFRGGALSLRNSMTFLGRALGPVLFAGLGVATGYRVLLLAAGIVALALGVVAVLATEGRPGPGATREEPA